MNITDIKYCIEEFKPEGFSIIQNKKETILECPTGLYYILNETKLHPMGVENRFKKEIYPLFLQRVRRGLNTESMEYSIDIDDEFLRLKDKYGDVIQEFYDNDQNLESAIKYIIDKVRG